MLSALCGAPAPNAEVVSVSCRLSDILAKRDSVQLGLDDIHHRAATTQRAAAGPLITRPVYIMILQTLQVP
jgi:hypothetical protein